jgi:hypothetical protein
VAASAMAKKAAEARMAKEAAAMKAAEEVAVAKAVVGAHKMSISCTNISSKCMK